MYDPARPNDYELYCEHRRITQKNMHILQQQKEKEKEADEAALDLHISGEEAWLRRARLSGKAPERPPSPPPDNKDSSNLPTVDPEDLIDEEVDGEPWDQEAFPLTEDTTVFGKEFIDFNPYAAFNKTATKNTDNKAGFAVRIMAKMGWKEGHGLGKQEQGIKAPLVAKKTDRRSGVIIESKPILTVKGKKADDTTHPKSSNVLLLTVCSPPELCVLPLLFKP